MSEMSDAGMRAAYSERDRLEGIMFSYNGKAYESLTELQEAVFAGTVDKVKRLAAIGEIMSAFSSVASEYASAAYNREQIMRDGRQALIVLGVTEQEIDDAE